MKSNIKDKVLNPNVLYGHEGSLLTFIGFQTILTIDGKTPTLKRGDVIMFIEASAPFTPYSSNNVYFGYEYIRVVHEDKVLDLNINPKNWMYHFTPYPRGGFVPKAPISK